MEGYLEKRVHVHRNAVAQRGCELPLRQRFLCAAIQAFVQLTHQCNPADMPVFTNHADTRTVPPTRLRSPPLRCISIHFSHHRGGCICCGAAP